MRRSSRRTGRKTARRVTRAARRTARRATRAARRAVRRTARRGKARRTRTGKKARRTARRGKARRTGKKALSPWIKHVMAYHKAHSNLSYKEAMKKAKYTYKQSNPMRSLSME